MYHKCNTKMSKLTKIQTIRFTEKQVESLEKLKECDVNISNFIRIAIREKLRACVDLILAVTNGGMRRFACNKFSNYTYNLIANFLIQLVIPHF